MTYCIGLLSALFWAISLPFSRFILGVHSLDQLIYGSTIGILVGLTMHFFVRDHLLVHIEKVTNFQKFLKTSLKNNETLSTDFDVTTSAES